MLKKTDGTFARTPTEKAKALNDFFVSVFTKENLDNIPGGKNDFSGECLRSFEITSDVVLKKLRELKPGKSPGPDGWHPVLLKNIADLIAPPLAVIFQKSLDEGVLPPDWLKACVTAIFKKE